MIFIQTDPYLSPNQLLLAVVVLFMTVTILVGGLFLLLRRQLTLIESKFGPVKPFWQHVRTEAASYLRHPHDWALEKDQLMEEAEDEPEVPMAEDRYQRLLVILADMVNNPKDKEGMRPEERDYAAIMLLALPLARKEATIKTELTGIRLVGGHAPPDQSAGDAEARDNAG